MTAKLSASSDGSYASLSVGADEVARFGNDYSGQPLSYRNKIINGAMVYDQRNGGASLTQTTSTPYSVDRFFVYGNVTSKFSIQRNADSITPPPGFNWYVGMTSLSSYTIGSGESYRFHQPIEGINCYDLDWGLSTASPATLSFWVRSTKTGTFGGSIYNGAANRCCPFSYTINAANTWEKKAITIPGDTTGTWEKGNLVGIYVTWSLGAHSNVCGTAGVWGSSLLFGVTGQTNIVDTNAAKLYLTGVQFEKGSIATPFEHRNIAVEYTLCQRYYQAIYMFVSATVYQGWFRTSFRDTPVYLSGGGAGFTTSGVVTTDQFYSSQTTGAYQTLRFSAEYGNL